MANHFKDRKGQRFTRLLVMRCFRVSGVTWAECRCDCGKDATVKVAEMVSGHVKSCGCFRREYRRAQWLKHDEARDGSVTPEYLAWASMKARCYGNEPAKVRIYQQRGIVVCDRWRNDYAAFLADMGRRPSADHSLDRFPDNSGPYSPENCRWATRSEQARNRRPRPRNERGDFAPGVLP